MHLHVQNQLNEMFGIFNYSTKTIVTSEEKKYIFLTNFIDTIQLL